MSKCSLKFSCFLFSFFKSVFFSIQLYRSGEVSRSRVHAALLGARPQSSTNTLWNKQGLDRKI